MKFVNPGSAVPDASRVLDLEHLLADERWHPLLDLVPDGVLLVDRGGTVRYVNSAAEDLSELLRVEVVGRSLADFAAASQVDCGAALDAFASGSRVHQVATNRQRRPFLLTTRSVRDWTGEMTCFVILLRDLEQGARAVAVDAKVHMAVGADSPARSGTAAGTADTLVLGIATTGLLQRGLKALALGSRLLLTGESGAGKTEFARALHSQSGVSGRPFVHVNCGSIPETLFESEMFGYERGSFTGASAKGKKGLVEAAEGGILFLDEIGEIPLSAQAKMLQFLEESTIQRVGATQLKRLRAQIIAATNRDLAQMVEAGTFRRDLYYRLSVVTLALPPLRECPDILDRLIDRTLARLDRGRDAPAHIEAAARARLRVHDFPGNVRELQNLVEHLAVVCDRSIGRADVERVLAGRTASVARDGSEAAGPKRLRDHAPLRPLKDSVRDFEAGIVRETIRRAGSKRKAAELLGVDIATIVRKSRAPRG